jgi:ssDNA-binding Zn-finger/Zn-ribbon topoisomerase 1
MNKVKHRCPDCNNLMIRHQHQKQFWWNCSGYPRCFKTAIDYRERPKYLTKEQMEEDYFFGQLQYIKEDIKDLRAQILIRLIQKKGGIKALSEQHRLIYYELVEPIRATYSFAPCSRCNRIARVEDMLSHGEYWYVCDFCWGEGTYSGVRSKNKLKTF